MNKLLLDNFLYSFRGPPKNKRENIATRSIIKKTPRLRPAWALISAVERAQRVEKNMSSLFGYLELLTALQGSLALLVSVSSCSCRDPTHTRACSPRPHASAPLKAPCVSKTLPAPGFGFLSLARSVPQQSGRGRREGEKKKKIHLRNAGKCNGSLQRAGSR